MSHVFVIQGDIANLACDAWMLPTSAGLGVTMWEKFVPGLQERLSRSETRDMRSQRGLTAVLEGASEDEPQIVLTAVPLRGFRSAQELAPAVTEFFDTAAAATRTTPRDGRSKRLIAMPFFGTRGGAGANRRGEILDVLLETMRESARRNDVDGVLVLRDPDAYALAQLKRSADRASFAELDDELLARVSALAPDARSGRLVPFMGAGVSASAGAPVWSELIRDLAKEVFDDEAAVGSLLQEGRDVLDQAAALRSGWERVAGKNNPAFNDLVARRVDLPRYGLAPALLAALPAKEAITLNYDSLFELASADIDRPRRVIPRSTTDAAPGEGGAHNERWLLKLHGSVDAPRTIVLTRDDYLGYDSDRGALSSLVKAMLMTRHLLFVGFGLADDHFHEILFDVRRAVEGQGPAGVEATVLKLRSDPLDQFLWKGDLDVIPFGNDESNADLGRRLEIFLDALICTASSDHSYLLKDGFEGALTSSDLKLRALLEGLQRDAGPEIRGSAAWHVVQDALERLGARPQS
jgi:hypothetical protein